MELKLSDDGKWIIVGSEMYPVREIRKAVENKSGVLLYVMGIETNPIGEVIKSYAVESILLKGMTLQELKMILEGKKPVAGIKEVKQKDATQTFKCDKCGKKRMTGDFEREDEDIKFLCSVCKVEDAERIGNLTGWELSSYLHEKLKEFKTEGEV